MTATSKQGIQPATPNDAVQAILNKLATRAMALTGADIERIVRQARLKALARAVETLTENRDRLDALVKALFDAQALDGIAVKRLLKDSDRAGGS